MNSVTRIKYTVFVRTIALVLAFEIAVALLATGTRARRASAIALAVFAAFLPGRAFPYELPLLRFVGALIAALGFGRVLDHVATKPSWNGLQRVWHQLVCVDSRKMKPTVAYLDKRALLEGFAFAFCAALGFAILFLVTPHVPAPFYWIVRWFSGVAIMYTVPEFLVRTLRVLFSLLGFALPVLHNHPILSRTVGEFWGQRWNQIVGAWLREWCFSPLALRGYPALGILWAFTVSSLLHVYLVVAVHGWSIALPMGAFFVLQFGVLVLERLLHVGRWPSILGRAWTIGWLLLLSPLFIEPFLQGLFPSAPSLPR